MIKPLPIIIAAATSILLSGCGLNQPTPEMKYHLLDHKDKALNHRLPDTKIAINKVVLADYLTQPNLVMRVSENKLDVASYHSWAEPMGDAIQRILIDELNQAELGYGFMKRCKGCAEINVFVDHFYPDQNGSVVLTGRFTFEQSGHEPVVEYFAFSEEQVGAGYSESVKVMNTLLLKLNNKISDLVK